MRLETVNKGVKMSVRKGNSVISSRPIVDSAITANSPNPVTGGAIYTAVHTLDTEVESINAVIPTQATSSNQLADKAFVNSSIANNTANFIGTFSSLAELQAYTGPVTNNDYAFVATTSGGVTNYDRYKYTTATTPASWVFEYTLNNSSFTANQWDAINSNATQALIAQITTNQQNITAHTTDTNNPHSVTKAQVGLGNVDNTADIDKPLSTAMTNALALKANTADLGTMATESASDYTKTANLALVATSGSYNDLSNTPTLGTAAAAATTDFATAAQGALADTALQPGDNVSSLVNDAGYLTSASAPNGVEWAIFGTTTLQQILDWVNAGKMVLCDNGNGIHICTTATSSGASFVIYFCLMKQFQELFVGSNNRWSAANYFVQEKVPAGTSGQVLTYTGTAGNIGSATLGDGTITVTQGGVTKGTFTTNQTGNTTIALDAGGGSVDIDNTTITQNSSDELQAVATKNPNTASGATANVFNWVGTLAQYEAQNIETLHPEWVCFITDDEDGGDTVYSKTATDVLLNNKANISLDNVIPGIDFVIDSQLPTAQNNYTWYRKYKSGWVEQGGILTGITSTYSSKTLPVEMSDTNYTFICNTSESFVGNQYAVGNPTSVTAFQIKYTGSSAVTCSWQVSGMAATTPSQNVTLTFTNGTYYTQTFSGFIFVNGSTVSGQTVVVPKNVSCTIQISTESNKNVAIEVDGVTTHAYQTASYSFTPTTDTNVALSMSETVVPPKD